jgi:hypothetical protein
MQTGLERIWLPRDEGPRTRERHMISSEKPMVTIPWNCNGFHVIEGLPKGQRVNADSQCASVPTKLSTIVRQFGNETRRKSILHADNVRTHIAESSIEFCVKLDLRVAPHPAYSPDLPLSDYFPFGYIRDKLKGLSPPSSVHVHRATRQ